MLNSNTFQDSGNNTGNIYWSVIFYITDIRRYCGVMIVKHICRNIRSVSCASFTAPGELPHLVPHAGCIRHDLNSTHFSAIEALNWYSDHDRWICSLLHLPRSHQFVFLPYHMLDSWRYICRVTRRNSY